MFVALIAKRVVSGWERWKLSKVLRDARLTACCGQHYCNSCLKLWTIGKGKKRNCPHCRKEGFQSVVNKEKMREINELRVCCTNRGKGCEWVGALGALQDHLQSDNGCDYVQLWCTHQQCQEMMIRKSLANHLMNECDFRDHSCDYCGFVESHAYFFGNPSHYDECTHFPMECSNKCGKNNIRREDMAIHLMFCPLQPLDCPYKDSGCTRKIFRKDMESHIESSTQEHLLMVYKSFQEVARSNRQLKARIEKLEKKK